MARVARGAQVLVPVYLVMMEVRCVIAAVAAGALENRVISRVGVAGGAHTLGVAMGRREERVIACGQVGRQPGCRGVAGNTGGRPTRGRVIRVRRSGVIRGMAGVAIGRRTGKYIIDVAQVAGNRRVGAGQRERRVVVVEGRSRPVRCGMAGIACGREAGRCVVGIVCSGVIRLVAAVACGRKRTVVSRSAGVALDALHRCMEAGQRKRRRTVVEGR